ncbi:MAG: metallophosphoesterase, partial [Oligoflexales bacterium]|nr:metallophosphoesterase [Oligoflexales bacterium]
ADEETSGSDSTASVDSEAGSKNGTSIGNGNRATANTAAGDSASNTASSAASSTVDGGNTIKNSRSFVFVGDNGQGDSNQKKNAEGILKYCKLEPCGFIAYMGDNFPSGVSSQEDSQFKSRFEDVYSQFDIPFYVALGNHDYMGKIQAEVDYTKTSQKWRLPSRYYSYETEFASIFVMDTIKVDQTQYDWLAKGLKAASKPWKIVYGHYPVYSSGSHGNTAELVNKLKPILKQYSVDFYFSGHDHDKEVIQQDGITFVVCGTGSNPRSVSKPAADSLYTGDTLGFCHLALDEKSAKLDILGVSGASEYSKTFSK